MVRRNRGVAMMLSGSTDADIALELCVTPQTVRRWRMRPDVKARISEHGERAAAAAEEILERAAKRAAERLAELVESEGHVAARAAIAVLRFSGYGGAPVGGTGGLAELFAALDASDTEGAAE